MLSWTRWVRLAMLTALMVAAAEGTARAECGTCQICYYRTNVTIPRDYCRIANDEDGYMCCRDESIGMETHCTVSGDACYGVIIEDPPGGGGGGGGGSCNVSGAGWCPAECFSCRRY